MLLTHGDGHHLLKTLSARRCLQHVTVTDAETTLTQYCYHSSYTSSFRKFSKLYGASRGFSVTTERRTEKMSHVWRHACMKSLAIFKKHRSQPTNEAFIVLSKRRWYFFTSCAHATKPINQAEDGNTMQIDGTWVKFNLKIKSLKPWLHMK